MVAVGCTGGSRISRPLGTTEPLFVGAGHHHYAVSTDVELAQKYFDQGLELRYGFAFEAARRAFEQAAALDSACPMADMRFTTTMWHFGRTIALATLGAADAAQREYEASHVAYAAILMSEPLYSERAASSV